MSQSTGKLSSREEAVASVLRFAPWLVFLLTSLPVPILFLILFLTANATDSAAVYLLFSVLSLGIGVAVGLIIVLLLFFYRKRWLSRLRDKLAADGITASEVTWFKSELTSAERKSLAEIERSNPLLADAYMETLAARLTASRIISRSRRELLRVDRRVNRVRALQASDTASLLSDLDSDRQQLEQMLQNAGDHLAKARTRLQVIEATASRSLDQAQTEAMMRRLSAAQDQLPLVLEMANLEQRALREVEHQIEREDLQGQGPEQNRT